MLVHSIPHINMIPCLTYLCCSFLWSTDIDECRETAELCGDFSHCVNLNGSFKCVCKEGFFGVGANCTGKHGLISISKTILTEWLKRWNLQCVVV